MVIDSPTIESNECLARQSSGSILLIEVPAKIWRPKVISRYTIPEYLGEDIDSILDYSQYGKCVYKTKLAWENNNHRTDTISYNESLHSSELKA